jgi:hypothetical protein
MWSHLIPGLGGGVSAADAGSSQQRLQARLADLRLPACLAESAPKDWANWVAEPFTVAAAAEGIAAPPAMASIEVAQTAEGFQVTVLEPTNALTFPIGSDGWLVSAPTDRRGETIPVAASGGWLDDHTLRVEVIFLETPHRMDIGCSLPSRIAEAVWRHPPVWEVRLEHLHSPS